LDPIRSEIAAEQAHVDRAYERLEELRTGTRDLALQALREDPGGSHQGRLDRETMIMSAQRRLADLEIGDAPLVFGRMDTTDDERLHIGRVGVSDRDHEQLVMDWRAPAAAAFYRATGREPLGLVRRRHLICRGHTVVSIDDEVLDGSVARERGLHLVGEAALLSALDQARTGRMGDIVATIQAEQDEIVRAPLSGVTVVQGGPGTGKTAVALHRVAYLLYTHRFPLEDHGVLVIGPSPLFLRYVERVLPSLGEQSVVMATLADLVPTTHLGPPGRPEVVRLKGEARMAQLVANALSDRQRPIPRAIDMPHGAATLRIAPGVSRRIVERAKTATGTHNERRLTVERQVLNHLWREWQKKQARDERTGRRGPRSELTPDEEKTRRRDFDETIRRQPAYREALERMWPVLSPHSLLHDLFGSVALLKSAARGVLTPEEAESLHRPRSTSVAEVRWSPDDVPLLDEAIPLLGTVTPGATPGSRSGREDTAWLADRVLDEMRHYVDFLDPGLRAALTHRISDAAEEAVYGTYEQDLPLWDRTFGHVVVDEAQELSPMAWRMLARRCPRGSMTIVGDLGQAASPHAPARWEDLEQHLPARKVPQVRQLTVNYRTPAEIMDLASHVLAATAPDLTPPRSVRSTGVAPEIRAAASGNLVHEVAATVSSLDESVRGNLAVIAPVVLVDDIGQQLGLDVDPRDLLGEAHVLLTPEAAKGLEFDAVVVVEPALIVGESPSGLRSLYVAMTRPTQRLVVVHERPLPPPLL
jgi:hypothetical protein